MTKVQDLNMNEISAVQGGECPVSLATLVIIGLGAAGLTFTAVFKAFG